MSDSNHELEIKLGLKPFSDFEKEISPLLRRVRPARRESLLEKMYDLVAQKVRTERLREGVRYQATEMRARRKPLGWTRDHIENARRELLTAETWFPRGLPTTFDFQGIIMKLDEFEKDLAERERGLAILVHPKLKTTPERNFPLPSPPSLLGSIQLVHPFPGMNATAIDNWFISAMDKCLPKARPGRRSRFGRDEVIKKVFEILGQRCTRSRITQARNRIHKRTAEIRVKKA